MRTAIWNLRVHLACLILPGWHRHISIRETGEYCSDCKALVGKRQANR